MPGPIALRFKEPPPRYTAAPGYVDTIRKKIDSLNAMLANIGDDDPYDDSLRAPCVALLNAFESLRRAEWSWADDVHKQVSNIGALIRGRQQADAATVPTSGFYNGADRERTLAARAKKIELDMLQDATSGVLRSQGVQQEAADLAKDLAVKLYELQAAYDSAVADYNGPRAMADADLSMEAMMRLDRVENELRAMSPQKLFELFAGFVKRQEVEKCWTFIDAATTLIGELRATPAALIAKRTNATAQQVDQASSILTSLDRLAKAMERFRESQCPQSILVTAAIMSGARSLFSEMCGIHAPSMSLGEFKSMYLDTDRGLRNATQDPFLLDDDWIGRFISEGQISLPGWSPSAKTAYGVHYRTQARKKAG